jgi:branched-chain amino acid transport system substrate-binding protein
MRRGLIAVAVTLLAAGAVVTAALARGEATLTSTQAACTDVDLGFEGPLTGPAGFLGQEQLSWLQFGVQKINKATGTKFGVVQGDTQLKAPVARTVAKKFVADRDIMAVIGPSESQAVVVSAGLFERVGLAAVSGSATRTSLTNGDYQTFFRVVPNDAIQGPTIVKYITGVMKAKNAVVIDSQDAYSVPLARGITIGLKARGVNVSRESVSADDTDFSSIVANVGSNVDVVVFATQVATAANTLSNQLLEQGKKAVVFGTDGAYSPSQYKPKNGLVSVFAPDLNLDPSARAIVREYNRWSKNKEFGAFGPATYMAGLVAMTAITKACADGNATRPEVTRFVRRTNIPSIIGDRIVFRRNGDIKGGTFVIYKVTNGKYSAVG